MSRTEATGKSDMCHLRAAVRPHTQVVHSADLQKLWHASPSCFLFGLKAARRARLGDL